MCQHKSCPVTLMPVLRGVHIAKINSQVNIIFIFWGARDGGKERGRRKRRREEGLETSWCPPMSEAALMSFK